MKKVNLAQRQTTSRKKKTPPKQLRLPTPTSFLKTFNVAPSLSPKSALVDCSGCKARNRNSELNPSAHHQSWIFFSILVIQLQDTPSI